jgi:hypothetical protein
MELDIERLGEAAKNLTNPRFERIGVSKLRMLNWQALRSMRGPIYIDVPKSKKPVAVIVRYDAYLAIQSALYGLDD